MAQKKANHALRRERELRGWSQAEVAKRVGAPSPINVTRWERGVTTPSPHYRERLCSLYGKDAQELGFLEEQEETTGKEAANQIPSASQSSSLESEGSRSGSPCETVEGQSPESSLTCAQPDASLSAQQQLQPDEVEIRQSPAGRQSSARLTGDRRAFLRALPFPLLALFFTSSPIIPTPGSALVTTRIWPLLQFRRQKYIEGPAVATVQYMLLARGYSVGSSGVDGSYGPDTNRGVTAFQKMSLLPENNRVDGPTWEHLIMPSEEGSGSQSSALYVMALQVQLNRQINTVLSVDGRFGWATEQAVRQFQNSNHLPVTGKADLDVWCVLVGGHISKKAR